MKKVIKTIGETLLATLLLFAVLEIVFTLAGAAPGASHFVEKRVIEDHLNPKKPKGEYRIFAFGESTIQGSHYGPTSSPPRWLEVYLKDFLPDRRIRVVNFARVGAGSYFVSKIFKETLAYHPDLTIFYLGHNAFLHGNRKNQILSKHGRFKYVLSSWAMKSRFISEVSRWFLARRMKLKMERPEDKIEFDVIETPPSGIGPENATPRNGPFFKENIEFSRQNFLSILNTAEQNHVAALFLKPVCNLKDFSPTYSVHMTKLTPEQLSKWENFYQQGQAKQGQGNFQEALKDYTQAYAIDPTYADLSFRLGQVYFRMGEIEKARRFFEEARDNDAIVLRATRDTLEALEGLKKERNLQLIDTEKILIAEAPGGILGEPIVEDNVHFSIKGHSLVGRALANEIASRNWIAPKTEWRFERERPYEQIAKELGVDRPFLVSAFLMQVNYFGSRFDNRVRMAQKALEMDPDNPRGLRYLAWTYWLMGKKDKALETYRRLAQVDPKSLQEVFHHQPDIEKAFLNKEKLPENAPVAVK